jgi:hypothetical protein
MRKKTLQKVCVDDSAKKLFRKIAFKLPYLEKKEDVIMAFDILTGVLPIVMILNHVAGCALSRAEVGTLCEARRRRRTCNQEDVTVRFDLFLNESQRIRSYL